MHERMMHVRIMHVCMMHIICMMHVICMMHLRMKYVRLVHVRMMDVHMMHVCMLHSAHTCCISIFDACYPYACMYDILYGIRGCILSMTEQ